MTGRNAVVHCHPDGKRLLYANGTTFDLMAPLLSVNWNFGPDAQRYIFVTTPDGGKPTPFTVVLNWAAALRK